MAVKFVLPDQDKITVTTSGDGWRVMIEQEDRLGESACISVAATNVGMLIAYLQAALDAIAKQEGVK